MEKLLVSIPCLSDLDLDYNRLQTPQKMGFFEILAGCWNLFYWNIIAYNPSHQKNEFVWSFKFFDLDRISKFPSLSMFTNAIFDGFQL